MKYFYIILKLSIVYVAILLVSCSKNIYRKEKKLPQVAVVGMLHFVSKNNTINQNFTDVKDIRRQQEIKDIVQSLKVYNPTKIAVERPYKSENELNNNYRNYLNGSYKLTAEETDQIAFRLAKELNHKRLFLVHSPVQYAFDSAVVFAKKNGQSYLIDSITKNAKQLAKEYDQIAEKKTIKEAIYYLNTHKAIDKNHYSYILLSQIGNKQNKIGAEAVGDWYKSNIKIFENIRQLIDSNSERVLVIYGQGHLKILNQLIKDTPELELIMINKYLK
ncbi:DUF5694 domain-containing protein [Tenacibaculum sp. IB213877]|uniref:DUF5694 domain-containing protein n=1 Tax=Tenacibaculum sp. IB213877 TaxID=3097351 RepID=UPI002A5AD39B|nr:DUF5694 domain-containing protein [Tenacibaculum sp. IB213877]MDY0781443.1 DUF5694 domain-containing protein [Tenacibaculum sp. IB213877]